MGPPSASSSQRMNPETKKRWVLFGVFLAAVVIIYKISVHGQSKSTSSANSVRGSSFSVWGESSRDEYSFAMVADLDRMSKVADSKKPNFRSIFQRGTLKRKRDGTFEVEFGDKHDMFCRLNEEGRGCEMSELVVWRHELYTFDDRTGGVFKVTKDLDLIPEIILMEGDGQNSKGQKTEWATVKDDVLMVGSFGKEYVRGGKVTSTNNMWIATIDSNGGVQHIDWKSTYGKIRKQVNAEYPGYIVMEAMHWDPVGREWWILPRRISSEPYDEKKDERKGSNIVLVANEAMTTFREMRVGPQIELRGWSSLTFLPNTRNKVIVALKTSEVEDKVSGDADQSSFITVFTSTGEVLLPQTEIPGGVKFEGIEIL